MGRDAGDKTCTTRGGIYDAPHRVRSEWEQLSIGLEGGFGMCDAFVDVGGDCDRARLRTLTKYGDDSSLTVLRDVATAQSGRFRDANSARIDDSQQELTIGIRFQCDHA